VFIHVVDTQPWRRRCAGAPDRQYRRRVALTGTQHRLITPTPDHCLLPAPDVSVVGCRLRPATACSEHVITDFVSTHSKATTSLLGHGHQLHRWTSYSIRHKTTTEQVCRSCLLCGISGTGFQRIECSSCQPTNSVAASREAGNLQHLTTHVDYCYAAL